MMTFVTICVVQNKVFKIIFSHMEVLRAGDFNGIIFDDLGPQGQGQLSRSPINFSCHVDGFVFLNFLNRSKTK